MRTRTIYISFVLLSLLMMLMTAGCNAKPDILEPVITLSEALEISRTEATIECNINRRGSSSLSYITLIYQEKGNISEMESNAEHISDRLLFRLSGLKPGTSYSCYIKAGTETATLKSNAITFTTIPNNPPKVSGITPLSTGPLGIIVKFNIIDLGGEDILSAGCEIKQTESMECQRVYATDIDTQPSEIRITISGLTPSTTYNITPFASNSLGESQGDTLEYTTKESVMLSEPGMLAMLFANDDTESMESITIAGQMNGDDFRTLRTFLGAPSETQVRSIISDIDLTDVSIVEGGGSFDGHRFTENNLLSTGLFSGCTRLRHALLPNSATVMDRDALARCPALERFTVPAGLEALLPSTDCPVLNAIEVSKANDHFSSIEGVLFNHDATEIIWFPCAKTGEYTLPSTITAIGENAFTGTSITTLTVPSSVTSISRGAFSGSPITEIRLPDRLANLSEATFQNCTNLIYVYLGYGTRYIGNFAFDGTPIRDLYLAAETPPFTMEDAFSNGESTIFEQCILHIPYGCKDRYTNHQQWGSFLQIEEFKP